MGNLTVLRKCFCKHLCTFQVTGSHAVLFTPKPLVLVMSNFLGGSSSTASAHVLRVTPPASHPPLPLPAPWCRAVRQDGQGASSWSHGSRSAALARRLLRAGMPAGQPGPALALPSSKLWAAAAEAPCPRRTMSSGRCPAGVLAGPGDIHPWRAQPAWRHSGDK